MSLRETLAKRACSMPRYKKKLSLNELESFWFLFVKTFTPMINSLIATIVLSKKILIIIQNWFFSHSSLINIPRDLINLFVSPGNLNCVNEIVFERLIFSHKYNFSVLSIN